MGMAVLPFIVLLAAIIVGFIHFYAPVAAEGVNRPWGHRSLLALSIVLFETATLLQLCWTSAAHTIHW